MALPSPYLIEIQFGASPYRDVSSWAKSISINKGISRTLDDYSAGQLSITFVNNDRTFDPLNTGSFLWYNTGNYSMVQPQGKIRVSTNGIRRFTGFIQDWNFSYDAQGLDGQATVTALDEIYRVSNAVFTGSTNKLLETTSDRMKRVMASNGFAASEYAGIQSGFTPVGADVNNAGDNVMNYLQNLARSEPGDLFSNASAVMVFKDRSFTNYTWANTTRQNLIKYPGTATVWNGSGTASGWTSGYQAASAIAPLYGGTVNKAQIVALALDTEMAYQEIDIDKYNPDRVAGTSFVFSGWFKAVSGAVSLEGDFTVLDANSASLGGVSSFVNIGTTDWAQLSGTVTVASGTPAGISYFVWAAGTTTAFGFYGNGLQVERGTAWVNYFDGTRNPYSGDASTRYEVGWLGLPYQSSSGMTISTASTATAPTIITFADQNSQGVAFGNGTGIPFTDLTVAYGTDQLFTQVQVVGINATATVTDSASLYPAKAYTQTDNLTTSLTKPSQIASGLLAEWRLPEYRASEITLRLESLTTAQQNLVLGLEIRDLVKVCFQPSATGSVVSKIYQVLAISCNADPERDEIKLSLSSIENIPIRLDSPLVAILDTDTLG